MIKGMVGKCYLRVCIYTCVCSNVTGFHAVMAMNPTLWKESQIVAIKPILWAVHRLFYNIEFGRENAYNIMPLLPLRY